MANACHLNCQFAAVRLFDVAGTCFLFSPHVNNVDISYSGDDCETTAFGDDTHLNLAGLKNYSITVSGWWAGSGGGAAASKVFEMIGASQGTEIGVAPGGSKNERGASLCYGACVNISSMDMGFPVDNIATLNFTATPRAGSLSACMGASWG